MQTEFYKVYGDDLLYVFAGKYTKNGLALAILRDEAELKESVGKAMHYSEDFESQVKVKLPTKNRRVKQMISLRQSEEIIHQAEYGVLAFTYEGVPYSVGLNHIYREDKLYFHSAKTGFKLNALDCPVSYLVVKDLGINEARSTHNHESVMIQGIMSLVEDEGEKLAVLKQLMAERAPSNHKEITPAMAQGVAILELEIQYLHGKSHVR